jgi:hypothetical protein
MATMTAPEKGRASKGPQNKINGFKCETPPIDQACRAISALSGVASIQVERVSGGTSIKHGLDARIELKPTRSGEALRVSINCKQSKVQTLLVQRTDDTDIPSLMKAIRNATAKEGKVKVLITDKAA